MASDTASKSSRGTVEASGPNRHNADLTYPAPPAMRMDAANLSPSQKPHTFVPRQRLIDMLNVGARQPVTLICAGAGWGKTALVASWAENAAIPVGWVTLDAADNNPGYFRSHVGAVLRETGAIPAADYAAEPGTSGAAHIDAPTQQLAQILVPLSSPVALVIDDLHQVDDPQIMADLAALLRHPPEQLRMVLISRTEPALSLHRFRAAGTLTEIRARDLQFTVEEAAELLAGHQLRPTARELLTLLDRTEGWPTGLQLAVDFLAAPGEGHGINEFAGDVWPVADYLIWEVLAHQRPEVRQFLSVTSVVDEICGELADAITGGTGGQRILEELERADGFVVRLASQPGWFRYHPLLRELLNHQLMLEAPTSLLSLHLRAAHWYSSRNATPEALRHAAAGRSWRLVGRMLAAEAGPFILSPDRTAVTKVLEQVPPAEFSATAELTLCAALLSFHAGDYDGIVNRIAEARTLLLGRANTERQFVEISLRTLETALARVRGDIPTLVAAATDVLSRLTEVPVAQLASALQYRAMTLSGKGVGLLWSGQPHHADRYLWAALTAARAARVDLVEIDALGHLALFEFLRGSLTEAYEYATSCRDLAERGGWSTASQVVPAYFALALVELERNNIREADRALDHGLRAHRASPEAAQSVVLGLIRIRLLMSRGELDAAGDVLGQARAEVDLLTGSPVLGRWVRLAESELDLASGHPENVKARYAGLPDHDRLTPREGVCLARAYVAMNDMDRAEEVLRPLRMKISDVVSAVEAWTVTALMADGQHRGNRSADALARAFSIAERQGVRRPFFTIIHQRMAPLVERQRWLVKENAGFVTDILAEMMPDEKSSEPPRLVDELSERETEVLRYLPTMLNASEIAVELHVSVNTVKAHLRSIYRKLGASRRREAVVRARALRLL